MSAQFQKFLDSTAIKFVHRNREFITFNDLFVYPNLRILKDVLEDFSPIISGSKLLRVGKRLLVFGEEQSGKTSLSKQLFVDALSSGFAPILIQGQDIKSSSIQQQIEKSVSLTYTSLSLKDYLANPNKICIIDDFLLSKINKRAKRKFIADVKEEFAYTIFIEEDSSRFTINEIPGLDDYQKLEILPFGNVNRSELIDKWVNLELTEEADDQQFWARKDELRHHVDCLVGKNVVPAKPLFILMLLQSFETMTSQRLEITSYGHSYQYLIYQALERVNVRQSDVDMYLNVLSELGGEILQSPSESIDDDNLEAFFRKYSSNFLAVDQEKVINDLINASILERIENTLKFRYRYLFYFFSAKNISDSLHHGEDAKKIINNLINNIHLEKSANIVLFLTHHSKDPWILDQILYSVMDIFSGEQEITLEKESLYFLHDFIKEIPELVMEQKDAQSERLKEDQEKDLLEEQQKEDDDNDEMPEVVAKINKVFRASEVCGQIFRNRLGSLERSSLELIYEESLSVSLRLLSVFMQFWQNSRDEAIRRIQKTIDQNPKSSDLQVIKKIESSYLCINYLIILAMLYKVSLSLGSSKGCDIYKVVTAKKKTPAFQLVRQIIELHFEKKLDIKKIEKLHHEFSTNPTCDRLLKYIVLRYCSMHDIRYQDRQRLAEKLKIPMDIQRKIAMTTKNNN
ncbi:NACHT domain-containing NTPase [Synechococcus sp. PCC 6312]|uniref:NACHT domain-containing protein n=1 Tax=Synechococcus sp. (strain ATCC 27167 / PCC 6312) TaxID=195253 RepID=UPI0002D33536|nr:hypothetical protein [Synechococcus sp. PCC 6312]